MPRFPMETHAAWYRARDTSVADCVPILESLRRRGLRLSEPEGSSGEGCALVFLSTYSDSLLGIIESLAIRHTTLLCIPTRDIPDSLAVWQLLGAGASDVIAAAEKSAIDQIDARLERWLAVDSLAKSEAVARSLIGVSAVWRRLVRQVGEVAHFTDARVLITGETGTGKELLARLIHELDGRDDKRNLITVDCTTIVPELSGSELFGHDRGAFTGALMARRRIRAGAWGNAIPG